MELLLPRREMDLLRQVMSVTIGNIYLHSCKPERVAGIDGFRCTLLHFRARPAVALGICLVDDGELSDVEVLWVREANAFEMGDHADSLTLADAFPSLCPHWEQAGKIEVAVLAATSPRRRFWAEDAGDFVRHDAGLRLRKVGEQVFITPSVMPFGDLFLSLELPPDIDSAFQVL
jgi:hypothetical protein